MVTFLLRSPFPILATASASSEALLALLQLLHNIRTVRERKLRQIIPDRRALRHQRIIEDRLNTVGKGTAIIASMVIVSLRCPKAAIGIAQIVVQPVLVQQILSGWQRRRLSRQLSVLMVALLHLDEHLRAHLGIRERLCLVLGPFPLLSRSVVNATVALHLAHCRRCRLALSTIPSNGTVPMRVIVHILRRDDPTARMVKITDRRVPEDLKGVAVDVQRLSWRIPLRKRWRNVWTVHLMGMSVATAVLLVAAATRGSSWWGEGTAQTGLGTVVREIRLHLLVLFPGAQTQRGQGARE